MTGGNGYRPRPEQAAILDRGLEMIQSVPYTVTARWLFYRILQEGYFNKKDDYKGKFLPLTAKARKCFYGGWTPDTLADDTRGAIQRGLGGKSESDFLEAVAGFSCSLDKWENQNFYIEVWFEARAMIDQFAYYTRHITLRAFGGDCSIAFKWQIAGELTRAFRKYKKPIVILYFGDLDPKGLQIPLSAVKDIRKWTRTPFEFVRCGLNPGDEITYSIPENFDKPGTFQWEALDDGAARDLITSWTDRFISHGAFAETEAREKEITRRYKERCAEFITSGAISA